MNSIVNKTIQDILSVLSRLNNNLDKCVLSFNGGKDCTVLLYLFISICDTYFNKRYPSIVYFKPKNEFEEVSSFINKTVQKYNLTIYTFDHNIQSHISTLYNNGITHIFMGQRNTDPKCKNYRLIEKCDYFTEGDMWIVNPILEWTYKDVWTYLKDDENREYCSLYDDGYTSLGDKLSTYKNILLCHSIKVVNGEPNYEYYPAYVLKQSQCERLSRTIISLSKYVFKGVVSRGKQFARTLGYPTANIKYDLMLNSELNNYLKCNPEGSIYPSFVSLISHTGDSLNINWEYIGMTYIRGNVVEVNIFDLDLNRYPSLYERDINIMIFDKIRDNIECSGLEELKECLRKDKQNVKQFFTFLNN
jgi:FAD synthetase